MKKCKGCHQEIDKYTIACEYCGKLTKEAEKPETDDNPKSDSSTEKGTEDIEKKPGEGE